MPQSLADRPQAEPLRKQAGCVRVPQIVEAQPGREEIRLSVAFLFQLGFGLVGTLHGRLVNLANQIALPMNCRFASRTLGH